MSTTLSDQQYYVDQLKQLFYGQYLTYLYAPRNSRSRILAAFSFNFELSRIAINVSEPTLRQIRLQWWQDALSEAADKTPRDHPVLRLIAAAGFDVEDFSLLTMLITSRLQRENSEILTNNALLKEAKSIGSALLELIIKPVIGNDYKSELSLDVNASREISGEGIFMLSSIGCLPILSDVIWSLSLERKKNQSMKRVVAELDDHINDLVIQKEKILKNIRDNWGRIPQKTRFCYLYCFEGMAATGGNSFEPFSPLRWHLKALSVILGLKPL